MNTIAKITHVAIMFEGEIYELQAPNRHHDVIRLIASKNGVGINGPDVQGFTDEDGNFLNRKDAMVRAQQTGQLNRREGDQHYQGSELYSEDLW